MRSLSEKREARLQRKQQKIATLYTLTLMNDIDRKKKMTSETKSEDQDAEPSPKRLCVKATSDEATSIEKLKENLVAKVRLSDEEFALYKKFVREQKCQPRFRLREHGEVASLGVDVDSRLPLFLTDIQHLIMYSLLGQVSKYSTSRWCTMEKVGGLVRTNVFVLENMSLYNYEAHESQFEFMSKKFGNKIEILAPKLYNGDTVQEIATVSLTSTQLRKYIGKHGNMDTAAVECPEVFDLTAHIFPIGKSQGKGQGDVKNEKNQQDKFPRTDILLSGWQLVEENFPLPIKGLWERKYKDYVLTKDKYEEVTPVSPMYGLDCEMCMTTAGELELTRVSIVDEDHKTLYDELVKPFNEITDYLTKFSGITAARMKPVTKRLADVQRDIRGLLPPDAIIVGQSLHNDFHALKMMHPYVIDTSIIFNITGNRNRRTKLQTLSREFLSERIQEGRGGHCSTEDSLASLKLAKLKLSKDIYFGDAVLSGIHSQGRQSAELGTMSYATSMLKQAIVKGKKGYIVATEKLALRYCFFTEKKRAPIDNKKITVKVAKTNADVVQMMVSKTASNLVIGHVKVKGGDDGAATATKVDEWVRRIWEAAPAAALNIVIFTGGHDAGNGVAFIDVKLT